ncbi:hypothetical protein V7S43_016425 [Phytophthora oleae]|uniref:Uncharacterized protein n=1 Tax=Phytophthora oleae TaxID=2107226 RepID=A0ABD3EYX5_9STRA
MRFYLEQSRQPIWNFVAFGGKKLLLRQGQHDPFVSKNGTSGTADRLLDELTDVCISGNGVLPRAIYDQVGDMKRTQTLQRMAEDPHFTSICTEIWKVYHSATI